MSDLIPDLRTRKVSKVTFQSHFRYSQRKYREKRVLLNNVRSNILLALFVSFEEVVVVRVVWAKQENKKQLYLVDNECEFILPRAFPHKFSSQR